MVQVSDCGAIVLLYQTNHEELLRTHKRSKSLAKPGTIDPSHELATLWSNIKMFMDSREASDGWILDLNLLGFFGEKLDEYSQTHMVSGDESIGQMLLEWRGYCLHIADFDEWMSDAPAPKPEKIKVDDGLWLEDLKVSGLNAEAKAISCCGMVHRVARVKCSIDRGHVNGEYGDKMNKSEQKEMLVWGLSSAAKNSPDSCWSIC